VFAAGRSDVRDVLVGGDVVIADRRPTRVDVGDVRAEALEHVGGA